MNRNRPSAADLKRRIDVAAQLLADGMPRTATVSALVERFGVDRRTARRYVASASELLAAEIGAPDLVAAMAEAVERLRRLAYVAERQGNLNAAVGAERAAISALVAIHRTDHLSATRLNGHTIAFSESGDDPPTDAQRRRFRESINRTPF
jgi:hypothetical protein